MTRDNRPRNASFSSSGWLWGGSGEWNRCCASACLILSVMLSSSVQTSHGYPQAMLVFHPSYYNDVTDRPGTSANVQMVRKRAFDRLDMSPFDFEALSKRFVGDSDSGDYYRSKKAFDRLDENGFFGMLRRRRAFDRLDDNSFILGKRANPEEVSENDQQSAPSDQSLPLLLAKRPFDRLDSSAFGIVKKGLSGNRQRLSIAQLLDRYPQLFGARTGQSIDGTQLQQQHL